MTNPSPCLTPETIQELLANARHPSEQAQAANAHTAGCSACREALSRAMPDLGERLWNRGNENELPSTCLEEEELLRYVTWQTDGFDGDAFDVGAFDVETVEMHLEVCHFCRAEVAELRAFQQEMENGLRDRKESPPDHALEPQPVPPVTTGPSKPNTSETESAPPPVSLGRRWRDWLLPPSGRLLPLGAGALLAAGVVYFVLVLPLRARLTGQQETFRRAEQKHLEAMAQAEQTLQATRTRLEGELARLTAQEKPKQNTLLAGAVDLSIRDGEGRLIQDRTGQIWRLQRLPSAAAEAVTNPQSLVAQGAKAREALFPKPQRLMGGGDGPKATLILEYPAGRVVDTRWPVFRWRAVAGAASYRVTGRNVRSGAEFDSGEIAAPAVSCRLSVPLSRGEIYAYGVTARNAAGEEIAFSRTVRFKALDEAVAAAIGRSANSPLTQGALYAKAGMFEEAARKLRLFLQKNPGLPEARLLLKAVERRK